VSNSPEVSSLVEKLNETSAKQHALMQMLVQKEDEIEELRRTATQSYRYKDNELMQLLMQKENEIEELRQTSAQSISDERESCLLRVQQLQDALENERQITKQQERIMMEKVNNDEGSVTVLMEAVRNRDRHIIDLQKLLANAKLMNDTKPVPVDVEHMRDLESELTRTQTLLKVRSADVETMHEEMDNLKSDINRLLEQRENLLAGGLLSCYSCFPPSLPSVCLAWLACDVCVQKIVLTEIVLYSGAVEATLRGELEQAFAALRGADVGGAAMAGRDRNQNLHDQNLHDQNLHDLLALQEELVHELQMMKRDMSVVAAHNKALESEKESLLRELGEYTSVWNSQSDLIAPQQRKRAQRSAAPGGLNHNNGNGVASLQVFLWIFCVNL